MKFLFEKYSLHLSETQAKKFAEFLTLFSEKNKAINLSAIRDEKGIIEKHFIDSLMITKFCKLGGSIGDLGTGGGFPGIPLALYLGDEIQVDCIDSIGKKIKVVNECIEKLHITNARGILGRAEELAKTKPYFEKYDFLVSRAVAYFPMLLQYALPLVKKGGLFIAYKQDNKDEIQEGKETLKKLGGTIEKIESYGIDGQTRNLIFVRKR